MTTSPVPRTLVLMPMLQGFEGIRAVVAQAIGAAGQRMERLDVLLEDWEWLDWLHDAIGRCDLILADSTRHNPFVMYELGAARCRARPTLLLLDRTDSQISGSLDGSAFRSYGRDALDGLVQRLARDLRDLAAVPYKPAVDAASVDDAYVQACRLLASYGADTGHDLAVVGPQAFAMRLAQARMHGTLPPGLTSSPAGDAGLLAALVRDSRMVETMLPLRDWTDRRHAD